jgi:hypothetical protein
VALLYLADWMVRSRLLSIQMFVHVPSTLTAESFYKALASEIPHRFPSSIQRHLNSLDALLENDLRNFWANLPHSWNATPASLLRGKWSGRPVIIVSAGPSLTEAIPVLREVRSRALLLATGPAAGILMTQQICPDLVISVDPHAANLAHFQGWDTAAAPLFYYHRIHRDVLAVYSGPKFYFVMSAEAPIPLSDATARSDFLCGGSVAFSALQLAHYLEAKTIVFVGQDCAFADGHTHATGVATDRAFDINALPEDYLWVPGTCGRPVVTNRTYHTYLLYMQDYLLSYAKVNPGVRHVNTSPIGAEIQGMDDLPLEQALATEPISEQLSARHAVLSAIEPRRRIPGAAQKAARARWTAELDQLLARVDQSQPLDRLWAVFETTSFYAQAARSYGDVHYLYETRCRHESDASKQVFVNRFREHLRLALEELREADESI